MYAAAKARVGVTAELDIPPLLRQALAVHTMSPMFTENVEKIISAMIAGMNDDGETMRAILEGLVHMASTRRHAARAIVAAHATRHGVS
jgi:hypothetical protein